jgi:electron transport complex protein RnfB
MEPYKRLVQKLGKFPMGGVDSEPFLNFLRQLFSSEEAALCADLSVFPLESSKKIAKKWGKSIEETEKILEQLVHKAVIMKRDGKYGLLNVVPLIDGIYGDDKLLKGKDGKEISRLILQSFEQGLADEFFGSQTPAGRIVTINAAIEDQREIMPAEQIFEIIDHVDWIRLVDCACRKRKLLTNQKKCDYPLTTCMVCGGKNSDMGMGEYHANLESGRTISKEEAKELVRRFEKLGLVHYVDNNKFNANVICHCCPCCCDILAGLLKFNKPRAFAKANFLSTVQSEKCSGCGSCVERCPFQAIFLNADKVAAIKEDRCVGCGQCQLACENGAIVLHRMERETIPESAIELGMKMVQEKGRSIL